MRNVISNAVVTFAKQEFADYNYFIMQLVNAVINTKHFFFSVGFCMYLFVPYIEIYFLK